MTGDAAAYSQAIASITVAVKKVECTFFDESWSWLRTHRSWQYSRPIRRYDHYCPVGRNQSSCECFSNSLLDVLLAWLSQGSGWKMSSATFSDANPINGLWTPNAAAGSCRWLEKANFVAILAKVELHRSPLTAVNALPWSPQPFVSHWHTADGVLGNFFWPRIGFVMHFSVTSQEGMCFCLEVCDRWFPASKGTAANCQVSPFSGFVTKCFHLYTL